MVRKPVETYHMNGMIILKRILNKHDGMVWTVFVWLRTGRTGRLS
jgi:hypothetical protein